MSYACGDIVYGIPATDEMTKALRAWDDPEYEECEWPDLGFVQQYSGSGEATPYLGVRLGGIDECDDVDVAATNFTPTDEQKAEAQKLIAELPDCIRAVAPDPKVWIFWGSS